MRIEISKTAGFCSVIDYPDKTAIVIDEKAAPPLEEWKENLISLQDLDATKVFVLLNKLMAKLQASGAGQKPRTIRQIKYKRER